MAFCETRDLHIDMMYSYRCQISCWVTSSEAQAQTEVCKWTLLLCRFLWWCGYLGQRDQLEDWRVETSDGLSCLSFGYIPYCSNVIIICVRILRVIAIIVIWFLFGLFGLLQECFFGNGCIFQYFGCNVPCADWALSFRWQEAQEVIRMTTTIEDFLSRLSWTATWLVTWSVVLIKLFEYRYW